VPFPITLTESQYEALVALAREGTRGASGGLDSERARRLDAFVRQIERENGIERHALWIQWQEAGESLPRGAVFPRKWPPDRRFYLELVSRPIAKADVLGVLSSKARRPMNVLVTRDPGAEVGWTELDDFFVN
jgi:hypothetical protein